MSDNARASQVVNEVLGPSNANARASQIVLQTLRPVAADARASQVVLEVLADVFTFPNPVPLMPTLNGFSVHKKPTFATIVQTAVSGREVTSAQQAYPLWEFELTYEVLREITQNQTPYQNNSPFTEFQQISELFLACNGQYGRFYYNDPSDNSRFAQELGVGDGTTTNFPIVRTWGSGALAFPEQVGGLNSTEPYVVYLNGTPVSESGNWSISSDNRTLQFVTAPSAGQIVTMDFFFYYLCRFIEDIEDFEQFYTNLWALKALKFRSVKQ